jgi:hypothetical protein
MAQNNDGPVAMTVRHRERQFSGASGQSKRFGGGEVADDKQRRQLLRRNGQLNASRSVTRRPPNDPDKAKIPLPDDVGGEDFPEVLADFRANGACSPGACPSTARTATGPPS